MLRLALAAVHLIALGIGLGAVWARGRSLAMAHEQGALRRAFAADTWWGIAALLWIASGLWRLLAGTEKATSYYTHNHIFWAKMGLLVVILALEVGPMVTLIRWRRRSKSSVAGAEVGTARVVARVSYIQAVLILAMVVVAVSMARGYGVGR
jgi:putative membrane protein